MNLKNLLFLTAMLINLCAFSQREGYIWYFGAQAGLDFNPGKPVALTNGKLNTNEGCTSISTPEGRLLFYSDGIKVYDSTHNIMPNGSDLKGNWRDGKLNKGILQVLK